MSSVTSSQMSRIIFITISPQFTIMNWFFDHWICWFATATTIKYWSLHADIHYSWTSCKDTHYHGQLNLAFCPINRFSKNVNLSQGHSQDFSKGGSQQGHHPGIADYIWFILLLSLVYQRAQSYYRGMKAYIN